MNSDPQNEQPQLPPQAPSDQDGDSPRLPDGREDNRHFRRQRHRDCYCRGRNKNCPKCQGTGQLLPNWRENLHAARTGQRPQPAPTSAYASAAPSAPAAPAPAAREYPASQPSTSAPYERNDRQDRPERNWDRNDRGDRGDRQDRNNRRDRWQNRGGPRNQSGYSQNRPNQRSTIKMCPMCGEYVPNLRAHVLARHDD